MTSGRSGMLSPPLLPLPLLAEYRERLGIESDIRGHLEFLCETASAYDKVTVVELGTRSGNSTSAFLAAAEATGGQVCSVDRDEPQVPEWWRDTGHWSFWRGSDLDEDIQFQVKTACGGQADVLLIDTSHAYMHTLMELEAWVPLTRPGGVVLLHDTEHDPMAWEVSGVPQPRKPVMKAMQEFCADHGYAWDNRAGYCGLGVIKIPEDHGNLAQPGHGRQWRSRASVRPRAR